MNDRTEKRRVLVVDDSATSRAITSRMIKAAGLPTEAAEDGFRAIALLRAHPEAFQCVVTDLNMPRMTGLEFARMARTILPDDTPIYLLTVEASTSFGPEIEKSGVRRVLSKPISRQDVREFIVASGSREPQWNHRFDDALLRTIPDLLIRLTPGGRFIEVRTPFESAQTFPEAFLVGKGLDDCDLPDQVRDQLTRALGRAMVEKSLVVDTVEVVTAEPKYFEVRLIPLEETQALMMVRDVTDSENARRAVDLSSSG